jgi:hypothetical protein
LDELSNLALACRSCNLRKGTGQRARDPSTGHPVRLFDPRREVWGEHSQLSLRSSHVESLTPVGRPPCVASRGIARWRCGRAAFG